MELESQNKISFLDILITKTNNAISTNVFRKNCLTFQGLNYYSFYHNIFKINSCHTLINRAYHIYSDWFCINKEFEFLEQYFKNNCSPSSIFHKTVNKFLNLLYQPKFSIPTVPKKIAYFSFPYLDFQSKQLQKYIFQILNKLYPVLNAKIIFYNPLKIGTLFKFKDSLRSLMGSRVVYLFTCPGCTSGTTYSYVGSTTRQHRVRINGHSGISHRTLSTFQSLQLYNKIFKF